MFDLIVRNANIQDGRRGVDIACIGGKIAEVGSALQGESAAEIDAKGRLVTPPFVDCHIHMDTALTLSETVNNESGELYEGINLWANLKPQLSADNVKRRAIDFCKWAIAQGTLAIRSHVDVCEQRLIPGRAAARGPRADEALS